MIEIFISQFDEHVVESIEFVLLYFLIWIRPLINKLFDSYFSSLSKISYGFEKLDFLLGEFSDFLFFVVINKVVETTIDSGEKEFITFFDHFLPLLFVLFTCFISTTFIVSFSCIINLIRCSFLQPALKSCIIAKFSIFQLFIPLILFFSLLIIVVFLSIVIFVEWFFVFPLFKAMKWCHIQN